MLEDAKFNGNSSKNLTSDGKAWGTSFTLNGIPYAASLFWQVLRNPDDPFTEIFEASENVLEGADLYCIKKGKSPQYGLCISSQGYSRKMRAAAVGISNSLSDTSSFLAVFKVDNGWWYVCVRNDVILSDGDMLFFNEEDAKQQFMSMLTVPDWEHKIAPAEWQIEETQELDLQSLLKGAPKANLRHVHALRGLKLTIVSALAVAIALWLIFTLISSLLSKREAKPIVAPVAIKSVQKEAPPPEPKPWEALQNPVEVLGRCFKAIQDVVTIPTPGWHIGGITCSSEGLVTSWTMQLGRLTWIEKALDNSGVTFSSRSLSPSGREVMAAVPVGEIGTIKSPPKYNGVDLVNTLNDLFQGLQMGINMNTQTWTSPQGNVYKSVYFSFVSNHDPKQWADILTKFSGLTISVIKYDVNNNSWYYEGAIYVL